MYSPSKAPDLCIDIPEDPIFAFLHDEFLQSAYTDVGGNLNHERCILATDNTLKYTNTVVSLSSYEGQIIDLAD